MGKLYRQCGETSVDGTEIYIIQIYILNYTNLILEYSPCKVINKSFRHACYMTPELRGHVQRLCCTDMCVSN